MRTQVDELIHALDASTLVERSRAERQLLELGPEALPFLPPPELLEKSVASREAVRRIRTQLERRAASESSAASRVTLQGDRSLSELLGEVERQTRNRIRLAEIVRAEKTPRLSVNWEKSLFWACLDEVCQRAQLQWRFVKDDASIEVLPLDKKSRAIVGVQHSGPFRIAISSVEIRKVIGDETLRIIRVQGRISIEPRLRPLFLSMAAKDLTALADDDRPLAPWNTDAKYEFPVGDGGREVSVMWDFRLPVGVKATAISIRGRLNCQIAAATERIVFDQKSQTRGAVRRRGGVSVRIRHATFEQVGGEKSNADIGVAVSYDNGGPAFESHRSWIFHNAAYLETKAGVKSNYVDCDVSQQSDGAVAIDYRWKSIDAPADAYRFVYEAPTLIVDVPIDIELNAIPVSE